MDTFSLIASGIIPFLVAIISSSKWPGSSRAILAFALCLGVGIWQAHGQFGPDLIGNVLKVFIAVQALYNGLLKHVGIGDLERGSTDAWSSLLGGIGGALRNRQAGEPEPEPSIKARLVELSALAAAGVITNDELNDRRRAILEEV